MEQYAALPKNVEAALCDLLTIYGEEIPDFFASLYDKETGGFYFSRSARDHEGFLPDLESTVQILEFLSMSGMVKDDAELARRLPSEVKRGLISFTRSLQDKESGYFYHPQWGKDIIDTRRGRDQIWAIKLFQKLEASPLYPTARDRLAEKVTAENSALPPYLMSREAFLAHLEKETDGRMERDYGWAHRLNAITIEIEAAGLLDTAIDFLNARMKKETGLWSHEVINYHTVSAIMKAGELYRHAKRPFPYPMQTLESCISVACGEEPPKRVIFIYNPWSAIGALRKTLDPNDTALCTAFRERLFEMAPKMLAQSKAKLLLFKKEDGTFSFEQDRAMRDSQAVTVALGINEGDVNSTKIALGSTLASIYTALDIPARRVYQPEVFDRFCRKLQSNALPQKKPLPEGFEIKTK